MYFGLILKGKRKKTNQINQQVLHFKKFSQKKDIKLKKKKKDFFPMRVKYYMKYTKV